ncbi:MAG TPA: AAA family ATPase, partial [Pseudomonadaceae bacterium]|nr:AAA family ATPase [Pseudomonadaceae bacterium]
RSGSHCGRSRWASHCAVRASVQSLAHAEGGSVVVFIEEAQSMPLDTLEEVRLLSNLETHRHKLMQIVLFGQPELDRKLELKSIRQLRERITHSFQLEPLKVGEISEYLRFRLQSAGCPWPQLFHPRAAALLARASGGLSRRINILADKSLLAAYADPATRPQPRNGAGEVQSMVLPRHVRTAIADSAYKSMGSYRQGKGRLTPWLGYSGPRPRSVPCCCGAACGCRAVTNAGRQLQGEYP